MYRGLNDTESHILSFKEGNLHGGGDEMVVEELINSMLTGSIPRAGGEIGLQSAVTALSIEKARQIGKVFNLKTIWESMG